MLHTLITCLWHWDRICFEMVGLLTSLHLHIKITFHLKKIVILFSYFMFFPDQFFESLELVINNPFHVQSRISFCFIWRVKKYM